MCFEHIGGVKFAKKSLVLELLARSALKSGLGLRVSLDP